MKNYELTIAMKKYKRLMSESDRIFSEWEKEIENGIYDSPKETESDRAYEKAYAQLKKCAAIIVTYVDMDMPTAMKLAAAYAEKGE